MKTRFWKAMALFSSSNHDNPINADPKKWSNTLKQFVDKSISLIENHINYHCKIYKHDIR